MNQISSMINTILYKLRLKKRPESELNRGDILKSLPLRNQLIEWEVDDKGEVALVIPQKETLWLKAGCKAVYAAPQPCGCLGRCRRLCVAIV